VAAASRAQCSEAQLEVWCWDDRLSLEWVLLRCPAKQCPEVYFQEQFPESGSSEQFPESGWSELFPESGWSELFPESERWGRSEKLLLFPELARRSAGLEPRSEEWVLPFRELCCSDSWLLVEPFPE
jgi:hypothetical protein